MGHSRSVDDEESEDDEEDEDEGDVADREAIVGRARRRLSAPGAPNSVRLSRTTR